MDSFDHSGCASFPAINRAYNEVFRPSRLSLGLVAPLAAYPTGAEPDLVRHLERIELADQLGFSAVWLRDIPFNVPSFGDVGQVFDPLVYLGLLAGRTERIALGVASMILPLRHPAHVAKAVASADVLSGGRIILGVASGDRPDEYPAMNLSYEDRGQRFRESMVYLRQMSESAPQFSNSHGSLGSGLDMLPKPAGGALPLVITGGSQQAPEWIAEHGDGWMVYPREVRAQKEVAKRWQETLEAVGCGPRPLMQSLYVDLAEDPGEGPSPIHLGFRSGATYLVRHLEGLQAAGMHHVALNLRFNQQDIERTMEQLANDVLPYFHD